MTGVQTCALPICSWSGCCRSWSDDPSPGPPWWNGGGSLGGPATGRSSAASAWSRRDDGGGEDEERQGEEEDEEEEELEDAYPQTTFDFDTDTKTQVPDAWKQVNVQVDAVVGRLFGKNHPAVAMAIRRSHEGSMKYGEILNFTNEDVALDCYRSIG